MKHRSIKLLFIILLTSLRLNAQIQESFFHFLIVCIFGTGESIIPNVETMVKIKVAPRVYLIEYAVDKAQGVRNNIQRRY